MSEIAGKSTCVDDQVKGQEQVNLKEFVDTDLEKFASGAPSAPPVERTISRLYDQSVGETKKFRKVIAGFAVVLILALLLIGGLLFLVVDMAKDVQIAHDNAMIVKGSEHETVKVDVQRDTLSFWDVSFEEEMPSNLHVKMHIDMRGSRVNDVVEATFEITGIFHPVSNKDRAFLLTPQGYTIDADKASCKVSIDMGTMGTFPVDAGKCAEHKRRLGNGKGTRRTTTLHTQTQLTLL